jgi:hypothetical protein
MYYDVSPDLPALIVLQWGYRHKRAFWFAWTGQVIGGLLAGSLIGGYIYLVMQGHPKSAGLLLGGGAVSLVTAFITVRLDKS